MNKMMIRRPATGRPNGESSSIGATTRYKVGINRASYSPSGQRCFKIGILITNTSDGYVLWNTVSLYALRHSAPGASHDV